MVPKENNRGVSRELSARDIRDRCIKYQGLERDGKSTPKTYHESKLPYFLANKKPKDKTCDNCRRRFSLKCDAFASKHPEFASECLDYWEVNNGRVDL